MFHTMFRQVHVRLVGLIAVFAICQVIGVMCALPDVSQAQKTAFLEDRMACPMDETIMCPPSLTSSPERQIKLTAVTSAEQALTMPCLVPLGRVNLVSPVPWSLSSAFSIVPISIASSSVLRI